MHRVNAETLYAAHLKQRKGKATGVDGVSREDYDRNVTENISKLVESMKKFQYRPKPVKRVYIPKGMANAVHWEYRLMRTGWYSMSWLTYWKPFTSQDFRTVPLDSDRNGVLMT